MLSRKAKHLALAKEILPHSTALRAKGFEAVSQLDLQAACFVGCSITNVKPCFRQPSAVTFYVNCCSIIGFSTALQ
jgi:hypothetical protein